MVEHEAARAAEHGPRSDVADAIERRDMAWPPAAWEREPGAWRTDVSYGLEPFEREAAGPAIAPPPAPAMDVAPPAPELESRGMVREALEIGLMALVLFAAIRFVSQNYVIERESMQPTLQPGDMVLVNKLGYRLGLGPERGDVVVFHAWPQAGEKDFVKRVVGVPGDAVAVRDGHVEIDGRPIDEPYVDGAETTPDTGPILLGAADYYVMGDNRMNSVDSRAYGPLPRDRIVGKAWITYWPPSAMGVVPDGDPVERAAALAPDGASSDAGEQPAQEDRP